ncbi:apolipoprotein N-acyltransferase [Palleronia sp. LCG004]|uniref:apolipoprotein N-acyltransferase n=1 Tax=Palleronia sp. LCG004 TaxID=3079304 RepID=UPI002941F1AA|nr:apolipoprotein N-acyltransferase [Palleronia sp. LCG004]WOI57398.1 apolipoprotein N-acyltransferase [Palleronia sp. LCG004]
MLKNDRVRPIATSLVGGLLAGFGQVPFGLAPAGLVGLAILAVLGSRARSGREAALFGFAGGTGYFALTLHWIVEPFLVDVARHGWMAPFALILMATGFALFWAMALCCAHHLGRGGRWRYALAFGVALASVEMLRSYVLTGFPWSLLGYIWSESPGAQLSSIFGPFGLTLLTTLGAGCAAMCCGWMRRGTGVILLWAGIALAGWWVMPVEQNAAPNAAVVRLVQPNAPQDEKWDPDLAQVFFERQLSFSAEGPRPDLIVWPETAVPYLIDEGHPILMDIAGAAGGVPVVLGAQRYEGARIYNTLFVVDGNGMIAERYDKHHLVPFGEYMPFGRLTRLVGLQSFAAQDGYGYSAGPGPRLLDLGSLGRPLPLICYEAIFPQDVSSAPSRPDWLLQITNDAWFGTFAGPQQHLAQARMRAIEQGLPMVRVANTGISAVIDAAGRVVAMLPLGQAGYLDQPLPRSLPPTTYARAGDLPVLLLLVLAFTVLCFSRVRLRG